MLQTDNVKSSKTDEGFKLTVLILMDLSQNYSSMELYVTHTLS